MTHSESSRKFAPDDLVPDLRSPVSLGTHLGEKKAYVSLSGCVTMLSKCCYSMPTPSSSQSLPDVSTTQFLDQLPSWITKACISSDYLMEKCKLPRTRLGLGITNGDQYQNEYFEWKHQE